MGFAWNKLFRTNVIKSNNIRFKEKVIINEDVLFVCEYIDAVNSVRVIDDRLLYYRVNEKGATLRYKPDIIESNEWFINNLNHITDDHCTLVSEGYYCRVIRCLSNVAQFYCFHKDFKGNGIKELKAIVASYPKYNDAIINVNHSYLTRKQKLLLLFLRLSMRKSS